MQPVAFLWFVSFGHAKEMNARAASAPCHAKEKTAGEAFAKTKVSL
jgi:hypothetical protein